MASFTSCAAAANGVSCLVSTGHGPRCAPTFVRDGTWERLHHTLYERVRLQSARQPTPSAAILSSHSVKTAERGGPHDYDGATKLSGRKRHLFVDTLGLVLKVLVHPADIPDRVGARWRLGQLQPAATTLPRLEVIWADAG